MFHCVSLWLSVFLRIPLSLSVCVWRSFTHVRVVMHKAWVWWLEETLWLSVSTLKQAFFLPRFLVFCLTINNLGISLCACTSGECTHTWFKRLLKSQYSNIYEQQRLEKNLPSQRKEGVLSFRKITKQEIYNINWPFPRWDMRLTVTWGMDSNGSLLPWISVFRPICIDTPPSQF